MLMVLMEMTKYIGEAGDDFLQGGEVVECPGADSFFGGSGNDVIYHCLLHGSPTQWGMKFENGSTRS